MHNPNGMVADARKALEQEWMRARQPMYEPKPVARPACDGSAAHLGPHTHTTPGRFVQTDGY